MHTSLHDAVQLAAPPPAHTPVALLYPTDMSELKLEKGVSIDFCNGEKELMKWKLIIKPDDGIYKNGTFVFDVKVPDTYPHDPPKVLCETTVFHPNIDMEGHVCLNILREDWKPVLTMSSVIMGMQFLMLEPNADDPLNKEVRHSLPRAHRRSKSASCVVACGRELARRADRADATCSPHHVRGWRLLSVCRCVVSSFASYASSAACNTLAKRSAFETRSPSCRVPCRLPRCWPQTRTTSNAQSSTHLMAGR